MKDVLIKFILSIIVILLLAFAFGTDNHPYDFVASFIGGCVLGLIVMYDPIKD